MMLQLFNRLDKNQQRICLLTKGTFLDERQNDHFDIMLYELNGFYAEAFFIKNTNRVAFFKTFTDTEKLEPYLLEINISDIFQQAEF